MKKVVSTKYVDDNGMEFRFEPIDDTLTIKKTKGGYEARYLAQDDFSCQDDMDDDNGLFLVHYHRDYWIEKKGIITEDDLREWYQGEKIVQEKEYHIFPVSALIHSGVWLQLGLRHFDCDAQGWDTSHVGAVLVSKDEWKSVKKAEKAAESLIEELNKINSGEVFGLVKETYDKDKTPLDVDSCWHFVGLGYAKESLKEF